ncbi:MAG: two-component regulator propeller domain-containing protein [Bacteroidota bacterium]
MRSLLCLLFMGVPWALHAQAPRFERLDSDRGLSHNTVVALHQDQRGFLWIGTTDGLNRYDGYGFTVWRYDPSQPGGLPSNTVRTIAEDADGFLWIGTMGGLVRYDPYADTFTPIDLDGNGTADEDTAHLVTLGEHIWASSVAEPFFFRIDPTTLRVTPLSSELNADWSDAVALQLWASPADTSFWYTSTDGTVKHVSLDDLQPTITPYAADAVHPVFSADTTRLWVRAAHADAWPHLPAFPPLPNDAALRMATWQTASGVTWMATEHGLYSISPGAAQAQYHPLSTDPLGNYIWTLYEDRAGILWVGTRSGLYRHDPHRLQFTHTPPQEYGVDVSIVMALAEAPNGTRWIGTLGDGLLGLHGDGSTTHLSTAGGTLPGDVVWGLHADDEGGLWAGTSRGLFHRETDRAPFTAVPLPYRRQRAVASPTLFSLTLTSDGQLWVTGEEEVFVLDVDNRRVLDHLKPGIENVPTFQTVAEDAAGTVWVGTESAGLQRFDSATRQLDPLPFGTASPHSLPGITVWDIEPAADTTLWLGTELGLVHFDPATQRFTTAYAPSSVPGSIVYSVTSTPDGALWLGSNQGLIRFDPSTKRLRHFDAADGLGNTEFNRRAGLRLRDGSLLLGGLDGLTAFTPSRIAANPYRPPVWVTEVVAFNADGSHTHRPRPQMPLAFAHDDYTLTFAFAALNFTNPLKNTYAYRLDGVDPDWIDAGTARQARYTNLPPGDYTFRVKAANNDGLWNEAGVGLPFSVEPALWQTWWFQLGVIFGLFGLGTAAYRYRVRQLLGIERMRLRIAQDLHDDIGSDLSSIALLSDLARRQADAAKAEQQLTRIGTSARAMVGRLRDIVWALEPSQDTAHHLVQRLRDTAAERLVGIPWQLDTAGVPERARFDLSTKRHLLLFYNEALHNVVRHANAASVTLRFERQGSTAMLTIADDGRGFDPTATSSGSGLRSMEARAEAIGGTLHIDSAAGSGTTVQLSWPMPSGRRQ